jgi:hypothetical protein
MADAPVSVESIYRVARLLDEAGLPYAFIGGVALGAWAIPRGTFDLDLALSLEGREVADLHRRLEGGGLVVERIFERGFRDRVGGMEKLHLHLPVGGTLMAIDVFLAGTDFLRSLLARRRTVELGGGPVAVCSAADLLLLKLIADRPKDRLDVENLLAVQGVPEREYLETWAERLHVRDRLERTLEAHGGR